MSSKSNAIHPSYTRFYARPKNMNLLTPSDWAHFHRAASEHTRHASLQISSKSIAIRPSYTRFRLKEHLYTFDPIYLWIGQTSDFAHIHRAAPGCIPHASAPGPIEIQRRTSELQSFYWMKRWVCTPLATEKGGWRMRVTVSHLKIAVIHHSFAFFSPPQGAREVRPCAPTRACPPPHVLPPRLSCATQPSWAPRHSLCLRWTFCELVYTLWSPFLLLCWQLRIFEFLCDMPGSALYVCCECDHNWVMCVGVKNHTL